MPAQSFLSAKDLKCSEEVRTAAITLLGMLERGEWWNEFPSCGTIGCCGGWMEKIGGFNRNHVLDLLDWRDLFYPSDIDERAWTGITVEQAATALRAKLTTGVAQW